MLVKTKTNLYFCVAHMELSSTPVSMKFANLCKTSYFAFMYGCMCVL